MVMAMRYMIRPEHEAWTHGDPVEQVLNQKNKEAEEENGGH